jgi:hypothetical protein
MEVAAALSARDVALSESERLKKENMVLVRRLLELKVGQARAQARQADTPCTT